MNPSMVDGSLVHRLLAHEQEYPERVYLRQPRNNQWQEYTWRQVMFQARQVASFLKNTLLLQKGDHVAIYSKNCAEWFIADFGINLAGMVSIPLFHNQHQSTIHYILNHAEVKAIFVGKLENAVQARSYIPSSIKSISFDYHTELMTDCYWMEVLNCAPLDDIQLPKASDLSTIIYSSGTSGTPKGAIYTHQILANYLAVFPEDLRKTVNIDYHHLISYLPLAHVYERSAIEFGSLTLACDISFVESLDTFADNLREIQPTLFAAVPRIWGVFQQKIEEKMSPKMLSFLLKIPGLASLIKDKIKTQLGLGRCIGVYSGASHLPVSILEFFDKLDIPIQEGYGQTENFAYATLSLPKERRSGYVGSPRLKVDIKQSEEGELLIKSPVLMQGYYKEEQASLTAFTEGWLRTGDIVTIDEKKRVKILNRLSETFKNQKGEFIIPTQIEALFSNIWIEHTCLIGQELASNVLLVSLNKSALKITKENIEKGLKCSLGGANARLQSYEKISHIIIVNESWTPESNLLTPTLKIRRRMVKERYQEIITRAMEKPAGIVWEQDVKVSSFGS